MDIRRIEADPTDDERAAVDALLEPPTSAWDGGARGSQLDAHVSYVGGHDSRAMRQWLLPALQALQARVGWISEGGLGYVCDRLNVPPADAWAVATFYALLATSPRPKRVVHVCDDIACKCAGADGVIAALESVAGPDLHHAPHGSHIRVGDGAVWMRSPCLGMCDQSPAALVTDAGVHPRERLLGHVTANSLADVLSGGDPAPAPARPIVHQPSGQLHLLRLIGRIDPTSLDEYRSAGGYRALERALDMGAEAVIAEVTASKLLGRGGAAFPTGRKWAAVRTQPARPHYLVCNADESEPGTFKDRILMEGDPFALVEAMTIAAFAAGCEQAYLYIRGEYPLAFERMDHAIRETRRRGLLGPNILGRDLSFDIEIRRGAGAYICGEETALFESIEGKRGEPRNKPPFPVNAGIFGKPTVVNNVETLANIPRIIIEGGAAFASVGTPQSTGTRLFCVCGHVQQPGLYEAPFGTTLRTVIEMAGGLRAGRRLEAVLLGGAAGTFVRPDDLDLKLTHEDTRATGTTLGSGVVMVVDDTIDIRDLILRIAAFFRDESCGQCVPCRVGTVRQEEALHRIAKARTRGGLATEVALLEDVGVAMRDASICGLGQTAYAAVESAIKRLRLYEPRNQAS
ncbi:MAG TPA: NAD(P)H-dependent oxidoreductase subunit E [Vicinamibacterales bacterium]|jgi:NADH-quinone oxidoreductase subunit F